MSISQATILRAAGFMVLGGVALAIMQASVKLISINLHPFIITLYRTGLVAIVLLPVLALRGGTVFKTSSVKLQVLRGTIGGLGMLCGFTGLSLVPLAEATALLFTMPIFSTLLSIFFLAEKVGWKRWSAILSGFAGIVIIARPEASFNIGYLFLVAAAFAWSISILIAKKLTERDTIISITFWQAMGCLPLAFFASLFVWDVPSWSQISYLLAIAAAGTLGHALVYSAIKIGAISFILPLDYIRIIWSAALGFLLFGHLPTSNLYFGSFLIIAATSFLTFRESRRPSPEEKTFISE